MRIGLTPFQRDEIQGLLDVCTDDFANGDRDTPGWGTVEGHVLDVSDRTEAITDLRHRADFLESEGAEADRNGEPGARSLRNLAAAIEKTATEQ
jgi:hypothetical protein